MGWRLLNRDGTTNLASTHRRSFWSDPYHIALSITWPKFLLAYGAVYLLTNAAFACAYFLLGSESFSNLNANGGWDLWVQCFYFSVQTFGTIGYGAIAPVSGAANVIVTLESLASFLLVAIGTGIVFARFSRPVSKIIFSENAVISSFDGIPHFVIRIANGRLNQNVEARVNLSLIMRETTAEGASFRNFHELSLERNVSPVFSLSWTILHPITKQSPMYGMSLKDLEEREAEFIVSVMGLDDIMGSNIHARFSYTPDEIKFDHEFSDMVSRNKLGEIMIDLGKIHQIRPTNLEPTVQ